MPNQTSIMLTPYSIKSQLNVTFAYTMLALSLDLGKEFERKAWGQGYIVMEILTFWRITVFIGIIVTFLKQKFSIMLALCSIAIGFLLWIINKQPEIHCTGILQMSN